MIEVTEIISPAVISEIVNDHSKETTNEEIYISINANKNVHEFFAECFTLYRFDKTRLTADIIKFFDEITEIVRAANA